MLDKEEIDKLVDFMEREIELHVGILEDNLKNVLEIKIETEKAIGKTFLISLRRKLESDLEIAENKPQI